MPLDGEPGTGRRRGIMKTKIKKVTKTVKELRITLSEKEVEWLRGPTSNIFLAAGCGPKKDFFGKLSDILKQV